MISSRIWRTRSTKFQSGGKPRNSRAAAQGSDSPDRQKFIGARSPDLLPAHVLQRFERFAYRKSRVLDRRRRIAVGAAEGFGNDGVDDAELDEIRRGDLHAGRGVLGAGGVA